MNDAHPFTPGTPEEGNDVNFCSSSGCGKDWDDVVHQPSRYLSVLKEEAAKTAREQVPAPSALASHERAPGPPFVPSPGTPETSDGYVPRGLAMLHGRTPSPPGFTILPDKCDHPNGFGPNGCAACGALDLVQFDPDDPNHMRCPLKPECDGMRFTEHEALARHLTQVHRLDGQHMSAYTDLPWLNAETREQWSERVIKTRETGDPQPVMRNNINTELYPCPDQDVHQLHLWQPGEKTEWFTCSGMRHKTPDDPPFPCPLDCDYGAWYPIMLHAHLVNEHEWSVEQLTRFKRRQAEPVDENDAEAMSNSLDCPECGNAYLRDRILLHLREEEALDQEYIDEFARLNGLEPLPLLEPTLADWAAVKEVSGEFMTPENLVDKRLIATIRKKPGQTVGEQLEAMLKGFFAPVEPAEVDPYKKMRDELTRWWIGLAEKEAEAVVPKAVEYGALDLIQIGQDLALTAGRVVSDEEAAEMGVYFYLRGKLARWTDAVIRGARVSDDTLHDIGVYVRMAQRIRENGAWPGV